MAQNVNSENKTNPQAVDAKRAGMPKDCSKLTGKEKDRCIQATPVGPVDVQTGDQSKGKSGSAKERDRMKSDTQAGAGAPACVMNAINDALRPLGAPPLTDMPFTPDKILRALNKI